MSDTTVVMASAGKRPEWFQAARSSVLATGAAFVCVDGSRIGYAQARLDGLAQVDTEFVAFLDDDDILMPDWLELHRAKMAAGFDVVSGSYLETDADLKPLRTQRLIPATLANLRAGHCYVNDGALIRRSVLEGITWHPERDTAMMFSLWLDLAERGARFGVVETPCWYHRLHDDNMSAKLDERDAAWRAEALA